MEKNDNNNPIANTHLQNLFIRELRGMLDAEKQLLKGLKKLSSLATSDKLKDAFEKHHIDTESHIDSLKIILQNIGLNIRAHKCEAMEAILNEGNEIIEELKGSVAIDAALISIAQKAEHYEIAAYGCLVNYARLMKYNDEEKILSLILEQEKDTDTLLTEIAVRGVNKTEYL